MSIPFSFRTLVTGLLLVAVIVTGRLAVCYHDNYKTALQQNAEQQSALDQQAGIIASQAFNFNRFNQIAENANRLRTYPKRDFGLYLIDSHAGVETLISGGLRASGIVIQLSILTPIEIGS